MVEKKKPETLRFKLGIFFVILSCILPLLGLVVPFLGLPIYPTTFLVAFLLVGGPEVCLIIGAALAGKRAVHLITDKVKRMFRRGPPKPTSKARYVVGLVLLVLGNLTLLVRDYAAPLFGLEVSNMTLLGVNLVADVVIIMSFFILGQQFWEKLKRLSPESSHPSLSLCSSESHLKCSAISATSHVRSIAIFFGE